MANNLDLGQIYGLGSCPMGGCGSEGMISSNIPSLEQIAAYNTSSGTSQGMGSGGVQNNPQSDMSSGQAQMLQPPEMQSTQQGSQQMSAPPTMFPNAQPAANGVSNAIPLPMTQNQINAENPDMLTAIKGYSQPFPVTADSIQYLNSLMRTQIGRRVSVEFLIGSGALIEKSGYLLAVGANFILINEVGTRSVLSCDFYSIKFVTFYY